MMTSRIWFTAAQKAELWERWKNGQSAAAISRALERKNKTGVERIVVLNGGIGPAPRRRALAALRFEEREEISRGIASGPVDPADRPEPRTGDAILNLGGPLADGDHIEDMPLSTLRVVALGVTHPPRSTQLRRQL